MTSAPPAHDVRAAPVRDRALLLDPDISEHDRLAHIVDTALDGLPVDLLSTRAGRVELCRNDPLLFAALYFPHHIRGEATAGAITLNELHLDLVDHAVGWRQSRTHPTPRGYRDAYAAPREAGKSTWLFLILPAWAAAYEIFTFIAAFADSPTQAEQHLVTFRNELETNTLLRADFPALCTPALRESIARRKADSVKKIEQANGFVFRAHGINTPNLGLKEGERRPELIILDDIEKGEENYSAAAVAKRLRTLEDVILALSEYAQVVLAGTVTRYGSIIHQLVQHAIAGQGEEWITEQAFRIHYYPAIAVNDDGTERSMWPAKWTLVYLQSHRHERAFAKNMMNQPRSDNDLYWSEQLIVIGTRDSYIRTIAVVDGAVTATERSDYTAITVASLAVNPTQAVLRECRKQKIPWHRLRAVALDTLADYPECLELVVEANQGHDLWLGIFHDMPLPVRLEPSSDPKQVRIEKLLNGYQRDKILHAKHLHRLEAEQLAYPNVINDDAIDSAAIAVRRLFTSARAAKRPPPQASRSSTWI